MTDAELITALGWAECAPDSSTPSWCKTHDAYRPLGHPHCQNMVDYLDYIEQGMELERRNWTDGSTHYDGCHPRCEARMLRAVLTDLIAELRTTPRSPSARPPLWVRLSVAHAEARLREVQGDS